MNEPLLSTTLILAGNAAPLTVGYDIRERLEHQVDLVIDGGELSSEPTTVIDLSEAEPILVRKGKGEIEGLGID